MENLKTSKTFDSHQRLTIAFVLALISFFVLSSFFEIQLTIICAWNIFALTDIILAWRTIITKNTKETVRNAKLQDSSRSTILFFVITTAVISLIVITMLLKTAKHSNIYPLNYILIFAFLTVVISWTLVHTVFAIHYAHLFYSETEGAHKGGLEFPKDNNPNFIDFAYYSFVVGMTFQVSDVQVSSKRMRKLTLIHAVISFLFNTFILALSINIIAG
ncbi:MAG: DUF1345 domain-containing protein, partial [Flavobacterium sp.]|nr:DUF1345 domain-containing protein [Flavobacterium sp.]